MKTLITNAVLTDAQGIREGKILVENGTIKKIYKPDASVRAKYDREIDAQGLTVMPGIIDTHAHLRDPGLTHKEDLHTGLRAAAKGGITTVLSMANTKPVTDTKEKVEDIKRRAKEEGLIDVIQCCAATIDFGPERCVDFAAAREVTPVFSNDGKNIDAEDRMIEALKASDEYGFILLCHEEPETATVLRDIELLREHGGHLHICHISKKDTLDAIKAAKEEGLDISCEVTPHHLYASGLEYRVHPPFRTWNDRKALIEGVRDGSIDSLGTDHAPHTEEEKRAGAPGLINFETAFALYNTVFQQHGIDLVRFSEIASKTPAERFGLKAGLIETGYKADLIFVDPNREWRIDPKSFESKSRNTPFAGEWVRGLILRTMKDGEIIYDLETPEHFFPREIKEEEKPKARSRRKPKKTEESTRLESPSSDSEDSKTMSEESPTAETSQEEPASEEPTSNIEIVEEVLVEDQLTEEVVVEEQSVKEESEQETGSEETIDNEKSFDVIVPEERLLEDKTALQTTVEEGSTEDQTEDQSDEQMPVEEGASISFSEETASDHKVENDLVDENRVQDKKVLEEKIDEKSEDEKSIDEKKEVIEELQSVEEEVPTLVKPVKKPKAKKTRSRAFAKLKSSRKKKKESEEKA